MHGMADSVDGLPVIAAASHDTASAVAGTPLQGGGADAFISCGTWSLIGCERRAPVTTSDALDANVTNELGIDGSVRLLKNVTGLWLLEECRRWWSSQGTPHGAAELVAAAGELERREQHHRSGRPPVRGTRGHAGSDHGRLPRPQASRSRPRRRRSRAPSSTRSRSPGAPPSPQSSASGAWTSRRSTSSGVAPRCHSCVGSARARASAPWWPGRSRPRSSATRWCRR